MCAASIANPPVIDKCREDLNVFRLVKDGDAHPALGRLTKHDPNLPQSQKVFLDTPAKSR